MPRNPVDEQKLLIASIELLRRSVVDLNSSFIANTQRDPGGGYSPFTAASPGPAPAIDPETGQFVTSRPRAPQPPKKPPVTGYLESGAGKLAQLVASILDQIKQSKAGRTAGATRRGAGRLAGAFTGRARSIGRKFANSTAGKRLRKDFQNIRGVFGKVSKSKVGRAAGAALGGAGGNILGALSRFAGPLMALIGPLTLLSAVISSNLSGFQIAGSAFKLLAATIAPLVLPLFLLVATGLTELSDRIWKDIAPALDGFYKLVFSSLLPAVSGIIQRFQNFRDFIQRMIDGLANSWIGRRLGLGDEEGGDGAGDLSGNYGSTGAGDFSGETGAGGGFDDGSDFAGGGRPTGGGDVRPGRPAPTGGASGVSKETGSALSDVMREFRLSMGPKANFSGLNAVGNTTQLNALNQSPFEGKMLERMNTVIEKLDGVIASNQGQPEANYSGRRN